MDKKDFIEQLTQNRILYKGYNDFLMYMKKELGEDSTEFADFEGTYTADFQRAVELNRTDRRVLIEGEKLIIREANICDSDFISSIELHEDNSTWVNHWSLGWRVAKFGDADFLQTIIEKKDGTPIGFIIFRNLLEKEEKVELKRIAILDKGKGYGKETLYLAQKIAFEIFGTKRLFLSTRTKNIRAQSIYKATGFVPEMPDPCVKFHMDREDYYRHNPLAVSIRVMSMDDYDSIYDLWIHTPGVGLNTTDDSREGIGKYLKRNPDTSFVAVHNNQIIGVIMAGHDGRRGYIHHTTVLSQYRNYGIGRRLVECAMDALDEQGINKVGLVAFSNNENGNAFWERMGFSSREDLTYRNKNIHPLKVVETSEG